MCGGSIAKAFPIILDDRGRDEWSITSSAMKTTSATPSTIASSNPLRERKIKNPPRLWVRANGSIAPAVDHGIFLRAQKRLTLRWLHLTDDELLSRLRFLLEKEGRLSEKIINSTLGVPAINVFAERFGSLRNAYRLIGHDLKWDFDWVDRRSEFNELLCTTAADLAAQLKKRRFSCPL